MNFGSVDPIPSCYTSNSLAPDSECQRTTIYPVPVMAQFKVSLKPIKRSSLVASPLSSPELFRHMLDAMTDMDCSSIEKATPGDMKSGSPDIQHVEKKLTTPEERQAALTAALAVDPGVKAGSRRAFQAINPR